MTVSTMNDSTIPRFPRVALDVPRALVDELVADLFDLGACGIEERDDGTLDKAQAPGCVTLLVSFDRDEQAREALAACDPRFNPRLDDVVGEAWRDSWKQHFRPFHLTPSIVIRPPWEGYEPQPGEHVLELEPGRAFGTGLHATTSLVAAAIERNKALIDGQRILDVGCGTGILSFVALLRGASSARAIDNDPEAVAVMYENASLNALDSRIEADTTPLAQLPPERYRLVAANIEARVLIPMAPALSSRVAPGGLLVLSGVLAEQRDDVLAAYRGLNLERVEQQGEWISIELRASS